MKGWLKGIRYLNDDERAAIEDFLGVREQLRLFPKRPRGRPPKNRIKAMTNKERQRAYRQRKKGKALRKYTTVAR